ncbi:MAG: TolC family protein [Oscillatoriaceae cyanobacterium Prado104]|jgi:outer membrane protein TolC|nr:TolC family protein [Oscillatoriaceae cyanobacterium Prado104]
MTEPPDQNSPPPQSDRDWILRFSLILAVICSAAAILFVVFQSSPTVRTKGNSPPASPKSIAPNSQKLPEVISSKQPVNSVKNTFQKPKSPSMATEMPQENNPDMPAKVPNLQSNYPTATASNKNTEANKLSGINAGEKSSLAQPANQSPPSEKSISQTPPTPQPTSEATPNPGAEQNRSASVAEEQTVELMLSEIVFLSLENNRSIKNQYLERIVQKQDLAVANSKFEPILTPRIAISGINLRSGGNSSSTDEFDVSARVSMKVPTGGNISFGWSLQQQRVDPNGFVLSGDNSPNQNLQLSFNQPLLRGAGVNVNRASIEIAKLTETSNLLTLKSTLIDTITSAILAYRQLFRAQEALKIEQNALEIARRQVEITQALIDAGRLAQVEILPNQKAVVDQEASLLAAESELKRFRLALLEIIDLDLDINIAATENLVVESRPLELDKIRQIALANRADYLQARLNQQIAKYNVLLADNNRKWNLDFNTTYSGAGTFGSSNSDFRAGIILSREFGSRSIERDFQRSKINLLQSDNNVKELNQRVNIELTNAVRDVNVNQRQVAIAQQARELAQRQLEIEQEKLKLGVGSSRIIDIVNFQQALVRARNAELAARIEYLNSLTNLDRITGTTLDTWQVIIESK